LITFTFSGSIVPRFGVPTGLRWFEYMSIGFYAHQALTKNEFKGRKYHDGTSGDQVLAEQQIDIIGVWAALGALLLYTLICNILGTIALYMTSRKYRK